MTNIHFQISIPTRKEHSQKPLTNFGAFKSPFDTRLHPYPQKLIMCDDLILASTGERFSFCVSDNFTSHKNAFHNIMAVYNSRAHSFFIQTLAR